MSRQISLFAERISRFLRYNINMTDINKIFMTAINALFLITPRGSKKEIAELMHLSTGHFSDILSGRRGTSEERRRELCYLIRDNYLAASDFHYSDVLAYGQAILDSHPSVQLARQALYDNLKIHYATLLNEWHGFLETYDNEYIENSYQFHNKFININPHKRGESIKTGKPTPDLTPHTLTDSELADRGFLTVPFSTTMKLAAGNGGTSRNYIEIDEDADTSNIIIHGPTLGVHNANHLQAFRVDGDSMEPLIAQGGIVLVDKTITRLDDDRFREGGIYMLCWEDDGLCAVKRLRWAELGKLVAIESANPSTPTIFKKTKEIHQLIGKIIWAWREFE